MAAADEKQREVEERQDVTKQTGGAAFANFYGNLNRNVAMGGESDKPPKESNEGGGEEDGKSNPANTSKDNLAADLGFMDGFEPAKASDGSPAAATANDDSHKGASGESPEATKQVKPIDPGVKRLAMRKAREEKVAQARIRYFRRNGMSLEGITTS